MTITSPDPRVDAPPTLPLEELAVLLGLPVERAPALANGVAFTSPTGLACRLLVERAGDVAVAARPLVQLGLAASELAGDDVWRLLTLQARLLANGLWYLGASAEGQLQLVSLHGFDSAADLAAGFDVGHIVAMTTLRLLLQDDGGKQVPR